MVFWTKYRFNNLDKENYKKLSKVFNEGYYVKDKFLDRNEFIELKKEFLEAIQELGIREKQSDDENQEGIEYLTLYVDDKIKEKYPRIFRFKNNPFIENYFSTCEQKKKLSLIL